MYIATIGLCDVFMENPILRSVQESREKTMDLAAMGNEIKEKRLARNWTQGDLAEATDLTITYISLIERGLKCPALETFITIANALDVSADELLAGSLKSGFAARASDYMEKLETLDTQKQKAFFEIMDIFLQNMDA